MPVEVLSRVRDQRAILLNAAPSAIFKSCRRKWPLYVLDAGDGVARRLAEAGINIRDNKLPLKPPVRAARF
jgi:hypothetical protein